MFRRFIPAICASCGEPLPRAAAGRCPTCRKDFTPDVPAGWIDPRRPTNARAVTLEKERITAPRDPRRLP